MSRTFDLFVQTPRTVEELADELAPLFGTAPVPATFRDGRSRWAFDDDEVQVELAENEHDAPDRDMHFERFDHQVIFRDRRGPGGPPEVALEMYGTRVAVEPCTVDASGCA